MWFFLFKKGDRRKIPIYNFKTNNSTMCLLSGKTQLKQGGKTNFKVMNLNRQKHLLNVKDPLLASRFYTNYLGFKRIKSINGKVILKHPFFQEYKVELINKGELRNITVDRLVFSAHDKKIKSLYDDLKQKHWISDVSYYENFVHGFEIKDCDNNVLCFKANMG
jgi:hypothetical protein